MSGYSATQLGFDLGSNVRSYAPDPEEVRQELMEVLAVAKAASDFAPWDERTFQYHKTVFPQMAQWLPADECQQLCFEFAKEVERIELLLAA